MTPDDTVTSPTQGSLIRPSHGYHVYGWMVEMGLQGLQLEIYALIYSYSCAGIPVGRIAYFAAWTGAKDTAIKAALKTLKERGLVKASKGKGNSTLYFAPGSSKEQTVDRVEKRPTSKSENDREMVVKRPASRPENDPESVGIRPTLTRSNQKVNISVDELMHNRPVKEQALAAITALNLGFSKQEAEKCADKWLDTCRAHGWADRTEQPIRDWQAHLRHYARSWAANIANPAARAASNHKPSTSSYNDKIASEYR